MNESSAPRMMSLLRLPSAPLRKGVLQLGLLPRAIQGPAEGRGQASMHSHLAFVSVWRIRPPHCLQASSAGLLQLPMLSHTVGILPAGMTDPVAFASCSVAEAPPHST
mmetsp:Transcript_61162/g.175469  ORF Transcript_61162/g.175469 Transcript_61162/m.175469 type:complete len:108 (+) Transcript_61162:611-934(+)